MVANAAATAASNPSRERMLDGSMVGLRHAHSATAIPAGITRESDGSSGEPDAAPERNSSPAMMGSCTSANVLKMA